MDDDELVDALDDDEPEAEPENELDRLDPESGRVTLQCGIEVALLPLRTRQLFKLLRIITHGAGQALANADLNFGDEAGVFMQKLVSIVVFSIPDAEQEAIDFLASICEPVGLIEKLPADLSKAERARNIELWTELNKELWNPDPMDTLDIIEMVVRREGKDIQALGKRVRQFLELASKTGQLVAGKAEPASQEPTSSESSAGATTSSRTSTAGRTTKSTTSRSVASGKSSPRSRSASGTKNVTAAR